MLFLTFTSELLSLPTIEMSPVPELIFLGTVKGLLSFVINLSLLDLSLLFTIVLLVNANPSIRQKAAVSLSVLLLVFGLEISLVNVYALVSRYAVQSSNAHHTHGMNAESYVPGYPHPPPLSLLRSSSWESSTASCRF